MIPPLPYRIFAVDPATGESGWSVLDLVSVEPLQINIIATGYLNGQKLLRTRKEMTSLFQSQFCVLDALLEEYERLLRLYMPDQVACEGAYGHLHLAALISLTLATNALRQKSKLVLNKDIAISPPTISKLAFTGRGGADKDHMRLAYQTNPYLTGTVADDLITEHEIDSIAHGVGIIKRDILGTVVQISAKDKRAAKREKAERKRLKDESKQKTTL